MSAYSHRVKESGLLWHGDKPKMASWSFLTSLTVRPSNNVMRPQSARRVSNTFEYFYLVVLTYSLTPKHLEASLHNKEIVHRGLKILEVIASRVDYTKDIQHCSAFRLRIICT